MWNNFAHASYFNTTGVMVNGRLVRHRKIAGHVRLDGVSGFNPNYPSRAIGKVFECAEPCAWKGQNKVLFRRLVHTGAKPDWFLVVTRSAEVGRLGLTASVPSFDDPLAPLGERVPIPQSRESQVRGSPETTIASDYGRSGSPASADAAVRLAEELCPIEPCLDSGFQIQDFNLMTFRASPQVVGDYFRLFVNRRAYTVQSARPHPESGRHYYYRPTDKKTGAGLSLTAETLRRQLEGEITVPRRGINPATQGCKWIAIDADYKNALEDLLKLNYYLGRDKGSRGAGKEPTRGPSLGVLRDSSAGALVPGLRLRSRPALGGASEGRRSPGRDRDLSEARSAETR